MPFRPEIHAEIFELRRDFTALSLHVSGAANRASNAHDAEELAAAIAAPSAPWAEAHLEAWREAYRSFGSKPSRFPCSAEALRKRAVRDGTIRPANAVVDLYNAISLRFAIPIGGEDATGYAGPPTLRRAIGTETFDTVADGQPKVETVEPGEVIWCDSAGVTCRRWNWRQGQRTQLTEATTEMWFVLERLGPMPETALLHAAQALCRGLRRLSPAVAITTLRFDASTPQGANLALPE